MPTERTYRSDGSTATYHVKADKSAADIADATSKEKFTDTSRLGRMGKGGSDMPKQRDGESPAAFGRRMSDWRASQSTTPQKTALKGLLSKK